ncbi:hypothetical protein B5M47_03050 [candidate division CPR3 bacterium 4484_211]|uniref:NAD-dependent epimerase/dehydratase domain-containing protein n=1 Tax=candidate division CPR3 bacterium 4484_211 TaxID=1968527 RepID=A0A1W9NXJ8_UNCC3|nr:MAG: hypothetical protein B5M47_03050 [candidate division CPR3 bacterium 4484_211]
MNILLAGGSGTVGRNLINYLLERYPSYHLVNFDRQDWELGRKQYTFIKGDIRREELVEKTIKEHEIQTVINLAHENKSGIQQIETNFCGHYVLLNKSHQARIKKFIHLSSDVIYSTTAEAALNKPAVETDPVSAANMDSAGRIGAEALSLAYYKTYQLPVTILRPASILGPHLKPDNLISLFISSALKNDPLPIYHEGQSSQDWLYASDLCLAIDKVLHNKKVEGEIFNLGLGIKHSILDTAKLILVNLDKPESLLRFMEEKTPLFSRPALNIDKAKRLLGWEPQIGFNEALKRTIDYHVSSTKSPTQ